MADFPRHCARKLCSKLLPHAGKDKFLAVDHQLFCSFACAAAFKVEQKMRFPISHCVMHQTYTIGTSCTACNAAASLAASTKGGR